MEQKHAVIFGATGLIGGHLLLSLLGDGRYSKVTVIGRSLPDNDHPKLVRTRLALEALDDFVLEASVDEVFCCLGSTMKQAKTKAKFKAYDLELPLATARFAKRHNVAKFLWVSAAMSSPYAMSFHLRIKGELDEAIKKLELPYYQSVRPSLLLGKRKELRIAETIFAWFLEPSAKILLHGPLKIFRPIEGSSVADSLHKLANGEPADPALQLWPD